MPDHLVYNHLEETLEKASEGSVTVFYCNFCWMFVFKLVLRHSLKSMWDTLDSLQIIYFLRYSNVLLPRMLSNVLDLFNLTADMNPHILAHKHEEHY